MHKVRRSLLKGALAGGLLFSLPPTGAAPGRVLAVGPHRRYKSVAAAAKDARDGDTIEIEAGEYRADVAVWPAARLLIRAVNGRASLIADGAAAEGKAIWVLRGGAVRIENIDLSGARVDAFNGAGIRLENGSLNALGCRFLDNEMGILTANRSSMEVELKGCEFSGPREVRGDVPHNLYVGAIGRLKVTACYFHHANVGHLLKSRAQRNFILYNRLSDENGQASYELEFSNGGSAQVIGNLIQQSVRTQNPTLISYGAEGPRWADNRLVLAYNTLVNDLPHRGVLLAARLPNAQVQLERNIFVGGHIEAATNIAMRENARAVAADFADAAAYDYRLRSASPLAKSLPADPSMPTPLYEYRHPAALVALPATTARASPGAWQQLAPA
jgi:hypothetical protein